MVDFLPRNVPLSHLLLNDKTPFISRKTSTYHQKEVNDNAPNVVE